MAGNVKNVSFLNLSLKTRASEIWKYHSNRQFRTPPIRPMLQVIQFLSYDPNLFCDVNFLYGVVLHNLFYLHISHEKILAALKVRENRVFPKIIPPLGANSEVQTRKTKNLSGYPEISILNLQTRYFHQNVTWTIFENGHFWGCDVENWLFEKMVLWIWPICWIRF